MIWRSTYQSRVVQLVDFLTAVGCFPVTYYFAIYLHTLIPSIFPLMFEIQRNDFFVMFLTGVVIVFLFKKQKAYSYQRFTSVSKEFIIVFKVTYLAFLVTIALIFLFKQNEIPRTTLGFYFILNLIFFLTEKLLLFNIASRVRKKGEDRKRIILIGTGSRAQKFIEIVKENLHWGLDIVGLLTGEKDRIGEEILGLRIIDHYDNIESVLKKINPEEVIITISTKRFDQIRTILEVCEQEGVQVRLNSDFFGELTKRVAVDNVFGLNIISFYMTKHSEAELLMKRTIDIIGSLVAILIFSPFMLIAAIGILITDGKPILYQWNVVGLNKNPIKSWKFRTMVKDADAIKMKLSHKNEMEGPVFKIKDDPRIIPFGKWLRKWSIDETPQLFSVLKGDLSLVGPRPSFPHELEKYESWQRRKLSVKPGITCLWQIKGRNHVRNFDDWVKMDLEYIDNWSIWLDLEILLKTIPAVISGKGAS